MYKLSQIKKNSPKIEPLRCVPSFKSLAQVLADIWKCPISSQTIKYKFKSNQFFLMLELTPSRCVPICKSLAQKEESESDMSEAEVLIWFQIPVEPKLRNN